MEIQILITGKKEKGKEKKHKNKAAKKVKEKKEEKLEKEEKSEHVQFQDIPQILPLESHLQVRYSLCNYQSFIVDI